MRGDGSLFLAMQDLDERGSSLSGAPTKLDSPVLENVLLGFFRELKREMREERGG